jgi:hypothetical protein
VVGLGAVVEFAVVELLAVGLVGVTVTVDCVGTELVTVTVAVGSTTVGVVVELRVVVADGSAVVSLVVTVTVRVEEIADEDVVEGARVGRVFRAPALGAALKNVVGRPSPVIEWPVSRSGTVMMPTAMTKPTRPVIRAQRHLPHRGSSFLREGLPSSPATRAVTVGGGAAAERLAARGASRRYLGRP